MRLFRSPENASFVAMWISSAACYAAMQWASKAHPLAKYPARVDDLVYALGTGFFFGVPFAVMLRATMTPAKKDGLLTRVIFCAPFLFAIQLLSDIPEFGKLAFRTDELLFHISVTLVVAVFVMGVFALYGRVRAEVKTA